MNESIHAAEFISSLTNEDMEAIDNTEMGFGPIIEGAQYAWNDNFALF